MRNFLRKLFYQILIDLTSFSKPPEKFVTPKNLPLIFFDFDGHLPGSLPLVIKKGERERNDEVKG